MSDAHIQFEFEEVGLDLPDGWSFGFFDGVAFADRDGNVTELWIVSRKLKERAWIETRAMCSKASADPVSRFVFANLAPVIERTHAHIIADALADAEWTSGEARLREQERRSDRVAYERAAL